MIYLFNNHFLQFSTGSFANLAPARSFSDVVKSFLLRQNSFLVPMIENIVSSYHYKADQENLL